MADISSIKLPSGNTYDIKDSTARSAIPTKVSQLTNDSGFITGMTILSYGSSTWADFEAAYNANKVVYCRASSNANPASGSQTRLAFMAYVNNATTPTNVEFQYYRSVKSHTASQQGDQVFVYKLDKTSGWSVTVRETYTKIVAGTGLDSSYANGALSLTCDLSDLGITATATELNYTDGVTSNIQDQLDAMAKAVSYTASGAIASFVDGEGDKAFVDLVANIEPVQDLTYGDPYPAGGGKNKFYSSISNSATLNGVTCSFDANTQTFTINGANGSSSAYILLSVTPTEDIVRNVALSRAFIGAPTGVYINFVYNDGSWHGLNNGETLPDSVSIENVRIQVGILGTAGSFTTTTFKCQLQEGSSAPTSWTPYENICPISGWTGCNVTRTGKNIADKNIFDINKPSWSTAQYWLGLSENADGTYTLTRPIGWGGHGFVYIGTYPAGTYTVSFDLKSTASVTCGAIIRAYNTKTWVTNAHTDKSGMSTTGRQSMPTITTTAVCDFWLAVGPYTSNGSEVISGDYQVEVGKTATAYESYQGSTATLSWQTEAGTVYGGTIDVATGLLTVDRAMVDMGDLTWSYSTSSGHERFTSNVLSPSAKPAPGSTLANAICSMYKTATSNQVYAHSANYIFCVDGDGKVQVYDSSYTDATSFKTAVTGRTICYELATPQTYQLTPQEVKTLLGTNNVWSDTGDVTVKYIDVDSDLSDYFVEKATYNGGQLRQDKNLAYVESGTRASRVYSVGDYVTINGALCKIIASVASGGTLTENTNYTVVTGGLASEFVTALGDVETLLASI